MKRSFSSEKFNWTIRQEADIRMRYMRAICRSGLCLFFLLIGRASGTEYPIRLHRPMSVGQEFQLNCQAEDSFRTSLSAGTHLLQSQRKNRKIELEAAAKVLETDPKGHVTKATFTVQRCLLRQGDEEKLLFPSQTVITATASVGKKEFLVDGRAPDGETHILLSLVIPIAAGDVTSDDIFGTPSPKKVGDSWPVSADPMAAFLNKQGMVVKKQDLEGVAYLEGIVKVGDIECLDVSSKIYIRKPSINLPPGTELKTAFASVRYSGKFPLDLTIGPLEEVTEMNTDVTAQTKGSANAASTTYKLTAGVKVNARTSYPRKVSK